MISVEAAVAAKTSAREIVVSLRDVTFRYGETSVLESLDLAVEKSTIFGLVGLNGAGKTTLIRLLAGSLLPTAGTISLFEGHLEPGRRRAKRQIGLVSDESRLFERLTVEELLSSLGRIYGISAARISSAVARSLSEHDLQEVRRKRLRDCSRGMGKRVRIAAAMLHDPRLLLMDEPFSGLDPKAVVALSAELRRQAERGVTVFLTSHCLDRVADLCDVGGVLEDGRLRLTASLQDLEKEVLGP